MKAHLRPVIAAIAAVLLIAPAIPAYAQDVNLGTQALTNLAKLVRWQGVLASVFVIAATWLTLRFTDAQVAQLGRIFAERRMMLQKVNAFFRFAVYFVVIVVVVLLSFEVSTQILALLGGTAAVAIGFATKDLAASVVAGIMIMLDRPFQLGDRVNFGGQYGDVTAIGLRSVKLQTLDDNTVTVPNNMFLNDITSCGNYGELDMQVVIDFHIGVDQDVRLARELAREAAITSRFVYLPKPVVVRIKQVILNNYVAIRVRLKVYVLDTQYEKALETDITMRVLEAFAENGILPPAILSRSFGDFAQANGRHDPTPALVE
ncbi:MAG: mechanosensitive ion channel [Alphaproteobacteria bacterium]|nr:mechanosensitive ion channel [Alphaproteobacteria bacterium]